MSNEIIAAFNAATTEAKYQAALSSLVKKGRNAKRAVKAARPDLHDDVNKLVRQGIVQDSFREHAVLDFDLDEYEKPAAALKQTAQKTLLIRKLIYPQQELSDEKRSSQLKHLEAAGIL